MYRTNDGTVGLGGVFHLGKPGRITESVITELRDYGYRLVTTGPGTLQGFDEAFVASGVDVYRYSKSNQLSKDPGLPEVAFSHRYGKKAGEDPNRVYRRVDGTWHVFCMEPTNAVWFQKHLVDLHGIPGEIGVFSDSGGAFAFSQGGNSPLMMNGKPWTLVGFLGAIADNVHSWSDQTAPRKWILNGLQHVTADLYDPRSFPGGGLVGMIENAFNSGRGALPNVDQWMDDADLVMKAQAIGWTPWVYLKLRGLTPEVATTWRRLMVPSMLLLDAGSLLFELAGSEGGPVAYVTKEYMAPVYRPDIGLPLSTETDLEAYLNPTSGLYGRKFERGNVIVNPHPVEIHGVAPRTGVVKRGTRDRRGRLRNAVEVPYTA